MDEVLRPPTPDNYVIAILLAPVVGTNIVHHPVAGY